ncbi:MAG: hypothetical protein FWG87_05000 [Defluviitaleaceae bacterium]|nr:hypothetical protein [Defluviitaleaceae bacterium]
MQSTKSAVNVKFDKEKYPDFWADVEETERAVADGTAEFIRNDEELRKALGLL